MSAETCHPNPSFLTPHILVLLHCPSRLCTYRFSYTLTLALSPPAPAILLPSTISCRRCTTFITPDSPRPTGNPPQRTLQSLRVCWACNQLNFLWLRRCQRTVWHEDEDQWSRICGEELGSTARVVWVEVRESGELMEEVDVDKVKKEWVGRSEEGERVNYGLH